MNDHLFTALLLISALSAVYILIRGFIAGSEWFENWKGKRESRDE